MLRWANICIMKLFDVKFEKPVVENIIIFTTLISKEFGSKEKIIYSDQ